MKLVCPSCAADFPSDSLNVQADIAHCTQCGETYRVSELLGPSGVSTQHDKPISAESIANPPKGTWFRETIDGYEAGASLRSPVAFFLLPFTLVWAGGSLGGIYGTQIAEGHFDLFRTLFGLPFLIGSVFLIVLTLVTLFGKVVATVGKGELKVSTGVGGVCRVKRIALGNVREIYEDEPNARARNGNAKRLGRTIVIEGDRRITVSGLNQDRGFFMLNALRYMCLGK